MRNQRTPGKGRINTPGVFWLMLLLADLAKPIMAPRRFCYFQTFPFILNFTPSSKMCFSRVILSLQQQKVHVWMYKSANTHSYINQNHENALIC